MTKASGSQIMKCRNQLSFFSLSVFFYEPMNLLELLVRIQECGWRVTFKERLLSLKTTVVKIKNISLDLFPFYFPLFSYHPLTTEEVRSSNLSRQVTMTILEKSDVILYLQTGWYLSKVSNVCCFIFLSQNPIHWLRSISYILLDGTKYTQPIHI